MKCEVCETYAMVRGDDYNYCPICGEPLTPPVPLTLEQLRERSGKPVWIQDIECPERSCWRLCYWDRGKYLVLVATSQTGYLLDEYGEYWVAYDREPKEEAPL